MSRFASALYVGSVRHRRHRPSSHAFRHRSYHVLIDVDELPDLDREVRGFGYNRRAVTTFRDTDHFGPLALPVREKLGHWLAARGVELPAGRVMVLANLRVAGHVFNPVSWWFCHHADGSLAFVVAEVDNTFGESHSYLLDDLEPHRDGTLRARADKVFHVSPFLPIEGLGYGFTIVPPGAGDPDERILVHMDVEDDQGRILDATQDGRRVPLTSRSLARVLLTHPLMPLRTVLLIHAHALALWAKGVRSFRKPAPPDDGYLRDRALTATKEHAA
jgi:uncharacterized protein